MSVFSRIVIIGLCSMSFACSSSDSSSVDLYDAKLTDRTTGCANYTGTYTHTITDSMDDTAFIGSSVIATSGSNCTITANNIPSHDVDSSGFATALAEVSVSYTIPQSPSNAGSDTDIEVGQAQAVLLSGAKIDVYPDACYGVGSDPLGSEKTGCGSDESTPWRYDPVYSGNSFGADSYNAHTQPSGAYHYHGDVKHMYDDDNPTEASGVIGFAADGYPLYGPYIDDSGTIRRAVSGYTLKSGSRTNQAGEGAFPGGTYDGTFRDDYEFTDAGDLDACNGMTDSDGNYGYYLTNTFPYVPNCFKGTPDSSFGP